MFEKILPQDLKNYSFWENTALDYIQSVLILVSITVAGFVFGFFLMFFLKQSLKRFKIKDPEMATNTITQIWPPIYWLLAINISIRSLTLSPWVSNLLNIITIITIVLYVLNRIQVMVLYLVEKVFFKRKNENEPFDPSVMSFLSLIINLTLWLVVILIVLQNLGINVNTIAGSLGIAGVAVAFAMQNILADIFASFSLYFDQPFKIGHKIEFSGEIGRVEKIGIKTTRIRLESGELLVVSNKELAQAKVKNLSLRESYTQIIKLAIPTKTDSKKLNNITIWAEKIINQFEESTFEKANIKEIKADNFIIQIKYTIDTHIQARFEEIQEHIYLQLKDQLDAEEIVFEGA